MPLKKLELWYPMKPIFIGQGFGENLVPLYKQLGLLGHNGLDMPALEGTPVYAAHEGVVTFTGEDGSGGLGVVIRTKEQFDYANEPTFFKTIYWHLQKGSFKVKPGMEVKAGDHIANCDTTGQALGSHLHFGLKPIAQGESDTAWTNVAQGNGYGGAIDPMPYFNGYYAVDQVTVMRTLQTILKLLQDFLASWPKRS